MVHPEKGRGNIWYVPEASHKSAKVTSISYDETMVKMEMGLNLWIHEIRTLKNAQWIALLGWKPRNVWSCYPESGKH